MIAVESRNAHPPEDEKKAFFKFLEKMGESDLREYQAADASLCSFQTYTLKRDNEVFTAIEGGVALSAPNRSGKEIVTSYSFTVFLVIEGKLLAVRKLWFTDVPGEEILEVSGYIETFEQGKGLSRVIDTLAAYILQTWSNKLQKRLVHKVEDMHGQRIRALRQIIQIYPGMVTDKSKEELKRLESQRKAWEEMYGPEGTSPLLQPFTPQSDVTQVV